MVFLFHDFFHASAIAFIAFCQVGKSLQLRVFSVISALIFPQSGILPRKLPADIIQRLLQSAFPFLHDTDFFCNVRKRGFQFPNAFLPCGFIGLCTKQPGIQFRPSDIYLFHHGVKPAHFGFNGSPLVQFPDNGILARFYLLIQRSDFFLDFFQLFSHLSLLFPFRVSFITFSSCKIKNAPSTFTKGRLFSRYHPDSCNIIEALSMRNVHLRRNLLYLGP